MNTNILDTLNVKELGRNLQEARKKRGLTQEDAARVLQVARTTITAIEKGERRIKSGELIKLADAYGRQVSDFVRPRPTVEPFRVRFRGPSTFSDEDKERIGQSIGELEELCRNYLELETIMKAPLVTKYPPQYQVAGRPPEQAGEVVAIEERNRLGLGDGPIPILRDILEQDVGLRIFYLPLNPSKFSGIYFYDDQVGGGIAVNSRHPEERRRWLLAHGYAHFLANRYTPIVVAEAGCQRVPESERFADSFAMHFLMPMNGLKRRFNDLYQSKRSVTPADLCILAHYYGISVEAITLRLEDMRLLPTGTWDKLQEGGFKIRAAQRELGLEAISAHDDKLPRRYQYLALQAFDEGLISEGQFARFLGLDRMQARKAAEVLRQDEHGVLVDVGADLAQPVTA